MGFESLPDTDRPPIIAAPSLLALINHLRGQQTLPAPEALLADDRAHYPDLSEIKGQESAKRVLEIAAAGGHNLLNIGLVDPQQEPRSHWLRKIESGGFHVAPGRNGSGR